MHLTPSDLSGLVKRVGQGDREAFARLYDATSAKIYGVALAVLRRPALAEDVLQDTYVRVWNNARSFDPNRASPITWMATIARNRAIDEARKRPVLSLEAMPAGFDIKDPQPLPSDLLVAACDQQRLAACMEALGPDRQRLVALAYLEGRSREELGKQFGHPEGTIKTWLHRALKQLKVCLSS